MASSSPNFGVDHTLVDRDLVALGAQLIEPFCAECLAGRHVLSTSPHVGNRSGCPVKGAAYELSVGDGYYALRAGEVPYFDIEHDVLTGQSKAASPAQVRLEPDDVYIIKTLECLHLPQDIKGRISLRAKYAQQLLASPGGLVDPGFDGVLYIPVVNMGKAPVDFGYGERMWTLELVRISPALTPGDHLVNDRLPLSRKPTAPEKLTQDFRELAARVDGFGALQIQFVKAAEEKAQALREELRTGQETLRADIARAEAAVATTENVVKALLGAGVAGLLAGTSASLAFTLVGRGPVPDALLLSGAAFVLTLGLMIVALRWTSRPRVK